MNPELMGEYLVAARDSSLIERASRYISRVVRSMLSFFARHRCLALVEDALGNNCIPIAMQ